MAWHVSYWWHFKNINWRPSFFRREMLPTTLKSMKQADSKNRMPEGRRSWCRYFRRRLHLSHVMEGLGRQRGVFCLPSQKHWACTGCQQHILYKDFLGRKFTEETDLIKFVKLLKGRAALHRRPLTTPQAVKRELSGAIDRTPAQIC